MYCLAEAALFYWFTHFSHRDHFWRLDMRGSEFHQARAARCVEPGWYRIYYTALLEGDRQRARAKIDRAQKAIHQRLAELGAAVPSTEREPQDLQNAQTYLGILLQHIGSESGNVLWD